jgi:hypothetical protein
MQGSQRGPLSPTAPPRRQFMSKAAVTHRFRKLKTPSKCRECDSYVYFQVSISQIFAEKLKQKFSLKIPYWDLVAQKALNYGTCKFIFDSLGVLTGIKAGLPDGLFSNPKSQFW